MRRYAMKYKKGARYKSQDGKEEGTIVSILERTDWMPKPHGWKRKIVAEVCMDGTSGLLTCNRTIWEHKSEHGANLPLVDCIHCGEKIPKRGRKCAARGNGAECEAETDHPHNYAPTMAV